ncbi:hypothetical protein HWV62_41655 [Athelia sp. TMB]|nr:hypothetical protein HWV62_41655 [Athelia sp. TMB]
MSASFLQAVKARRSYYALSATSPIPDSQIQAIVESAVTNIPSPFNVQSGRAVVVFGEANQKLWDIVLKGYIKSLGDQAPAAVVKQNEDKIAGYATGYGSVLFFEDQAPLEALAKQIAPLATQFPIWSENSTGMLQFAVWTALEAEGFGASLQHHGAYAPEISAGIRSAFGLPETWKSTALMPFGVVAGPPGQPGREKTFLPIGDRVKVFN